jgi:alkanesulfonate monooxygenase SsuD/methylene tetrahydromethanopterin reductase-like flavin-dependent oxidoreductase (luciferase family)
MLSLIGRAADGWLPSLGYMQPADLAEGNKRIDDAATAAGRDPKSIRRVLNAGFQPTDVFTALALDFGMDTFLISEDPAAMRKFASEVAPKVRDQVESQRLSRAH